MTTIRDAEHKGFLSFDDALNKSGLTELTPEQRNVAENIYSLLRSRPNAQLDPQYQDYLQKNLYNFQTLLLNGAPKHADKSLLPGEKPGAAENALAETYKKMVEFNTLVGVNYGPVRGA